MVDDASDLRWKALESARRGLVMAHALGDIIDAVRSSARAITGADGVTVMLGEGSRCH